jgi:hypothetical protein
MTHPNILIGAFKTQRQSCAKALGRIFRQNLAMFRLLEDSLGHISQILSVAFPLFKASIGRWMDVDCAVLC